MHVLAQYNNKPISGFGTFLLLSLTTDLGM